MMKSVLTYLAVALCSLTCISAKAQKPKPDRQPVEKAVKKFTPPKLTSTLGIRTDTVSVYVEEGLQLAGLPIKVTDAAKNNYSISSYQFMYKRRAVTEDEATGKVTPVISNVSDLFRQTPLPALWVKTIREQLRKGEELFFFDIVVKDAQGRLMYAPELRIKIK